MIVMTKSVTSTLFTQGSHSAINSNNAENTPKTLKSPKIEFYFSETFLCHKKHELESNPGI